MASVVSGRVKLRSPEFIWEVNLENVKNVGDSILSEEFSINPDSRSNQKFRLKLFPKGYSSHDKDCILLFLIYTGSDKIEMSYTISLLNSSNEKLYARKTDVICKPEQPWGRYVWFCTQAILKNPKNKLLNHNVLSISCQIEPKENIILNGIKQEKNIELKEVDHLKSQSVEKEVVCLTANKQTFYVHRDILSESSPVFKALLKLDNNNKTNCKIKINGIAPVVLEKLIYFIYNEKVDEVKEMVCQLLSAAQKYSVERLKTVCQNIMCNNINNKNAVEFLCAANENKAHKAEEKAIKYISSNLDFFMKDKKFNSFWKTHLSIMHKILGNKLYIDTEKDEKKNKKNKKKVNKKNDNQVIKKINSTLV